MIAFGEAIKELKKGKCIARSGWNGKNMYLYLHKGSASTDFTNEFVEGVPGELFELGDEGTITRLPNIRMVTPTSSIVEGWLASQTDMLAEDWIILD